MTTILLTEDNNELRATFAEILTLEGYEIIEARDGADAIEKLKTQSDIDLIMCDYAMPNMNGLEVLAFVRANPATENIPFVVLSGVRPPETEDEHIFVSKPVDIESLIDLLASLI